MKSNKKEVLSFDEWYTEAKKLNNDGFSAKDFFEAGQQSKQAEIDELHKRVDELSKINESLADEVVAYRSRFGNKGNRHEH